MNKFFSNKTPFAVLFALACFTLWPGCDNDDDDTTGPECNISGVTFSYNTNIKPIIDKHCISCHKTGSGVAEADQFDFTTYEGMESHLEEGHMRDRVVIVKDMPQGNPTNMTQAERDSINCWILAGYPK